MDRRAPRGNRRHWINRGDGRCRTHRRNRSGRPYWTRRRYRSNRGAGPTGATGANGTIAFADFYALMPPDNAATVATGTNVQFPQMGPTSSTTISQLDSSNFLLAAIGTYQVFFQVSVDEPGQLMLALNGVPLAYTVVGRATGTSQIVGMSLVTTSTTNSRLNVQNPSGNFTALTITPLAGGTQSVAAHLVITQIQ